MDGDFYLTVDFINATFSTTTEQPFTVNNSTSASFGWTLHQDNSGSKKVHFNIDPNVSGFSASLSIHSNQGYLKTNAIYPCNLQYSWNPTYHNFQ